MIDAVVDEMTETPDPNLMSPNSWLWNTQAPPPLSGQIRTDSRNWASATQLHINRQTEGNVDVGTDLAAVKAGDEIRYEHQTDPTRYARYRVSAPATLVGSAYVFPVTLLLVSGTLPNSGTRVLLEILTASGNTVNWTISAAREPSRFWITCTCFHGRVVETMALAGGGLPAPSAVVPTTVRNLQRRLGCTCDQLQPAFTLTGIAPQAYVQLQPDEVSGPS
jgi:hypothetical protein